VITEGSIRGLDIFFNGVKRDDEACVVVDKKSAPNGHAPDTVVFKLSTFLKKHPNVITKWTMRTTDRATRIAERIKP
jgi:hypothetical protein